MNCGAFLCPGPFRSNRTQQTPALVQIVGRRETAGEREGGEVGVDRHSERAKPGILLSQVAGEEHTKDYASSF